MDELKKHIDRAFRLLSGLSVSGDAVDVVAGIREELRAAYKLAEKEDKQDG